jgi:hypothetical protein
METEVELKEDGKIATTTGGVGEGADAIRVVTVTPTGTEITASIAEPKLEIGVHRGTGDTDILEDIAVTIVTKGVLFL